jgi:hypothetical protein
MRYALADVRGTIRGMRDRVAHASAARGQSETSTALPLAGTRSTRGAGLALIALLLGGCSAIVDTDLGPEPLACRIGEVNDCNCANGSDGIQRCNAGGSFDDCRNAAGAICDAPRSAGSGGSNRDRDD